MEATAAAAERQVDLDVDVWGTQGALASIEHAVEQIEEHRNNVSRAGAGNAGSQAGHTLSAAAAHLTIAIRAIEDGVHRLRAVRDGTAGAAPSSAPTPISRVVATEQGPQVTGGIDATALTAADEAPYAIPVSTDTDPFNRSFLTVRPSMLIADLLRSSIVRLGLESHSGTWCLHLQGRPLTDAMTAADAGIHPGAELVLLQVG